MELKHIRNFSIIAHIDHGKSTLADRMLEKTGTIEPRRMKEQVLDSMELERERGITIKMQPVRMAYSEAGVDYELNLIDTPGHIDFSYEVSRALAAVEGSLLLVDATQGVQAQTLTVLETALKYGVVMIPVITKIDSPIARTDEVLEEVCNLLSVKKEEILLVSGKSGEGVEDLLKEIIKRVPPPKDPKENGLQSLVFDFQYSTHRGVIVYVRVLSGEVKRGDKIFFYASKESFEVLEVGYLSPEEKKAPQLSSGEIGYIVTGIKRPGIAAVGDTLLHDKSNLGPLPGYMQPMPVVWASIYPEGQDAFDELRSSLLKLRLSDASFSFEEETSGALGRGFRVGFLGMLHLEIITERLKREFGMNLIVTTPSIVYEVSLKNGKTQTVYAPHLFPDEGDIMKVMEPWMKLSLIAPPEYMGGLMTLLYEHEAETGSTVNFGEKRFEIHALIPLRELMRGFFNSLKNITSGYGSVTYDFSDMREAYVTRLDIIVGGDVVPAFSKVVSKRRANEEAETTVEKLAGILPRQQVAIKIQGYALGRILSSRTLSAFRKDVTGYLYGGDVTRKMKLLEKQKKGKKKMQDRASVNIPHDVFMKLLREND